MKTTNTAPSRWRTLSRYVLAIAFVSAALSLSLLMEVRFGNPIWFFFPVAVISSTWFGGRGPGWVAVGLSTLAVLYFFTPPYHGWSLEEHDVPFLVTFVFCQSVANRVSSWRKETEATLRRVRDELEVKVAERTAELRTANEALLNQIAEQKRTEQVLQVTRTELARVVRVTTIGELTASIAHEVNQPLAAVVANADACVRWLSQQDPDLTEARAAAERTAQGAIRATEVIVHIRSLINKATPEKARIQIDEVIRDAVALADDQASRSNVSLAVEIAPGLPAVFGDRIQLQQVILNLMMNGIEAMASVMEKPRQLLIRSRLEGPRQIRVSVEDCGIGVSPDIIPRIFEPFFTTRPKGMGMGLPISRSIVEAHGGKLWVESNVSRGAIFQFTLPSADGQVT